MEDLDALLEVDAFERRLSEELGGLDDAWGQLSARLSTWSATPAMELFRWHGGRWHRRRPASGSEADARPAECVKGLVEGLVEEERIGAWLCSRPGSLGSTLRLRRRLQTEAELEVQVEAKGPCARVLVRAAGSGPVEGLSLRQAEAGVVAEGPRELRCELPIEQLERLELVVHLPGGGAEQAPLPITAGAG